MSRSDSASGDAGGTDRGVNRRTVLQVLGTGAVAGVGLVGTASGHWVEGKPVFCGCSQLCVCVEGDADVLMAQENDNGGFDIGFITDGGELDPYPTGEPRYNGNFCVSTDDENVPDGKIIGLQVAGTRWVNPNQCAQKALEAEQEQLDSIHPRPAGDSGGPCGKPPCEHPSDRKGDEADETGDIQVTWEDCETVSLSGPDDDIEEIEVHYIRCFEDPEEGCPDGAQLSIDDPDLPLTIGREELVVGDEQYRIDAVELIGDVEPDDATPPDDLDCSFESIGDEVNIEFEMDDQTITLGEDEDAVSEVTITGFAEFGYAGWEDDGPVGHAFITSWAQSDADIDFPDRDIQRYFDVDGDTDIVTKDIEIPFDVSPEVGDPAPGEAIETEIIGRGFFGLERGSDPEESENIGDWRESDPMTLRVEREGSDGTGDIEATWEDCETVSVTGSDEGLDGITVHYLLCFEPDGPCPDGTQRSIDDPDLPLTIEDQYLTVDDVPYTIAVIELEGDVEPDVFERPDDLDCSFE